MQSLHHRNQDNPARTWFDRGGHKNPPSAPPAIPPLINPIVINPAIQPFDRHTPPPAIDPRNTPPRPPVVPPRGPGWRI